MVNCTQTIFSASPEDKPKIISSDAFAGNAYYNAERVLTRNENDFAGTIWVIPEGGQGEFIMDMGLDVLLVGVELVNTVNRDVGRDRATRAFTVHLALAYSGPWTEILSEELENPLQDSDKRGARCFLRADGPQGSRAPTQPYENNAGYDL